MTTSEITNKRKRWATDEEQGDIEVIVVLLEIALIVLGRLSLVHCIEVETWIVDLDGLEESS